ncbi:hypothetical protein [Streptomyces kronopolitis]|uniref:hypothetical protein n=1 Tax=Streptomyces kronopolitis TaxID=1612435 RepID=UPI003435CE73
MPLRTHRPGRPTTTAPAASAAVAPLASPLLTGLTTARRALDRHRPPISGRSSTGPVT